MEVEPGNAVSIIECDMNVEFDAPEGYVEPSTTNAHIPFVKVSLFSWFQGFYSWYIPVSRNYVLC